MNELFREFGCRPDPKAATDSSFDPSIFLDESVLPLAGILAMLFSYAVDRHTSRSSSRPAPIRSLRSYFSLPDPHFTLHVPQPTLSSLPISIPIQTYDEMFPPSSFVGRRKMSRPFPTQ